MSVFGFAHAQEIKGDDAQTNILKIGGTAANKGVVRKFDNRYEGVKGSPFYLDSWSKATIFTNTDEQIPFAKAKYNAYEDELIVRTASSGQFYIPKNNIDYFILNETVTNISMKFALLSHFKKQNESQFYRILFEGKIMLLEFAKVVYEKADFEGGYSNDKRYDEYKKYSHHYYVGAGQKQPLKLKSTANAISKIFPGHSSEVKQFISKLQLDLKSQQDLVKIFEFYQNIEE